MSRTEHQSGPGPNGSASDATAGRRAFVGLALTSLALAVPYTFLLNLVNLTNCPGYFDIKRFLWTPPGENPLGLVLGWTALHLGLVILPLSLCLAAAGAVGEARRYPWSRLAAHVVLLILTLAIVTLLAGMVATRVTATGAESLFPELRGGIDPAVVPGFVAAEFRGTANMIVGPIGFAAIFIGIVRRRRIA